MTQKTIIMGANGGIGEALAKILISNGQNVFLTARDESTLSQFDVPVASVDVTDPDSIKAAIEQADEGEGIKGFAYCVGSIDLKPLKAAKDRDFIDSFELNVLGAVRALRAAEKSLKAAKGSVVVFSSVAVQQGFTNHSIIASAKGAVEGLMRSMAAEWAPHVRVNCIAPSLTNTEIAKPLTDSDQMREAIEKMHPIPRLGNPEDSAHMAEFLLSDKSGWITGQVFHVDGGRGSLRIKG
jgi:NAD(P)-dependent dehydrogenase (short-subunit alcohol dehydrogenase family)